MSKIELAYYTHKRHPESNARERSSVLRIIVCVKQVPDGAEIRIDEVKHTFIRAGVPTILNPFGEFAVEEAVRVRETLGRNVTVISMGSPQDVPWEGG
jgi:electron transfer flavoprotein alpha/beta subunit